MASTPQQLGLGQCVPTPDELQEFGVPERPAEWRMPWFLMEYRGQEHTKHKLDRVECPNCGRHVLPARLAKHQASRNCGKIRQWREHMQLETQRAELDKSRTHRVLLPLAAAGGLPQHWVNRNHLRIVRHEDLFRAAGYKKRSSYSRAWRKALPFVSGAAGFGKPLNYKYTFAEGSNRRRNGKEIPATDFCVPSLPELLEHKKLRKYFAHLPKQQRLDYYWIPGWIFDPKTPATPNQKSVLTFLAYKELFSLDKDTGRCKGSIQISLPEICSGTGLSRDTVRRALRFWSDDLVKDSRGLERRGIGILRIKEFPGQWEVKGSAEINGQPVTSATPGAKWAQPPNEIIYLPSRKFNAEMAQVERAKFALYVTMYLALPWGKQAADIFESTLQEWEGTEKRIHTFYRACRERMQSAGIPQHAIDRMLPHGPPG